MQTRRGFLALFAHLPVVGAMFGKRENSDPNFEYHQMVRAHVEGFRLSGRAQVIEWIPVTERLPEYTRVKHVSQGFCLSDNVLVCFERLDEVRLGHRFLTPSGANTWGVQLDGGWHREDVTHWAELPSPPEGGR